MPIREILPTELVSLIGRSEARRWWQEKLDIATAFMKMRAERDPILIEVAAQHPLVNGRQPNEEFASRLLLGKQLYDRLKPMAGRVEVYVPGSRHVHGDVADHISLSSAGSAFLCERGVSQVAVHGDDLNLRYKGTQGVYCSADECFVTASYFRDGGFGRLISIVSPVQALRKMLHFIAFGVIAECHAVPAALPFHDILRELFDSLPYVLFVDHDLQGPSLKSDELRRSRMPISSDETQE